MDIHDFSGQILKDLTTRIDGLTERLIKVEASQHDRLAGHIQGLNEAREIIKNTRKTWTMREPAHEEEL